MHGYILTGHRPSHSCNAGTVHVGFRRLSRHCVHQARSAVGCVASCIKGGLHPTKNRLWGGLRQKRGRSRFWHILRAIDLCALRAKDHCTLRTRTTLRIHHSMPLSLAHPWTWSSSLALALCPLGFHDVRRHYYRWCWGWSRPTGGKRCFRAGRLGSGRWGLIGSELRGSARSVFICPTPFLYLFYDNCFGWLKARTAWQLR